jgi:chromosome condensin MukBEF MukE localization factor
VHRRGILFVVLNQLVNQKGGFLRTLGTTALHLQRRREKRVRSILSRLRRLSILEEVPDQTLDTLAAAATERVFPAGATIFRSDDPGEHLYVVAEGPVSLHDPGLEMKNVKECVRGDAGVGPAADGVR